MLATTRLPRQIATSSGGQQTAQRLAVSVWTVERHITNPCGQIDARDRAEATRCAPRDSPVTVTSAYLSEQDTVHARLVTCQALWRELA